MAEYQHGSMDIRDHENTFHGFIRLVSWACVVIVGVLVFIALVNS